MNVRFLNIGLFAAFSDLLIRNIFLLNKEDCVLSFLLKVAGLDLRNRT